MKTTPILLACSLFAGLNYAHAVSIEFTSAEGYTDDSPLNNNADWGGHSNFTVDNSGNGTVILDGASSYKKVFYKSSNLSVTSSQYSLEANFRFNRIAQATLSSNKIVLGIEFGEKPATNASRIAINLQRRNYNASKYRLTFSDNSGNSNTTGNSSNIDEGELGFGADDATSDLLSLRLELNRGDDASKWTATGYLFNLESATPNMPILTFNSGDFDTISEFFNDPLIGFINSSNTELDSQTSNRIIENFSILSASPTAPQSIEFSAAENFSAGDLSSQFDSYYNGWYEHNSTSGTFVVNPSNSGFLTISNTNFRDATYAQPLPTTNPASEEGTYGDGHELVVDFVYARTAADNPSISGSDDTVFRVGLTTTSSSKPDTNNSLRIGFSQKSAQPDSFLLKSSLFGESPRSALFSGASLGLSSDTPNDVSDMLRLTLSARYISGSDWEVSASLVNLNDTDTIIAQIASQTITTDQSFSLGPQYLTLNSFDIGTLGDSVEIQNIAFNRPAMPAIPAEPVNPDSLSFNTSDGYSDDELGGQTDSNNNTWSSNTSGFTIDSVSGTLLISGASNYGDAIYSYPITGTDGLSYAVDFSFVRPDATRSVDNNVRFFRTELCNSSEAGSATAVSVTIEQSRGTDNFRMFFFENSGESSFGGMTFDGAAIGIDDNTINDSSDSLQVAVSFNYISNDNWRATAQLTNLTTGYLVAYIDDVFTTESDWTAADKFFGLNAASVTDLGGSVLISDIPTFATPANTPLELAPISGTYAINKANDIVSYSISGPANFIVPVTSTTSLAQEIFNDKERIAVPFTILDATPALPTTDTNGGVSFTVPAVEDKRFFRVAQ